MDGSTEMSPETSPSDFGIDLGDDHCAFAHVSMDPPYCPDFQPTLPPFHSAVKAGLDGIDLDSSTANDLPDLIGDPVGMDALGTMDAGKDPPYDPNTDYRQKWSLIALSNDVLSHQIIHLQSENKRLKGYLDRHEKSINERQLKFQYSAEIESERDEKRRRKHNRRCAAEVVRNYSCTYPRCEKKYGSEGSLKLHIKRKHGGDNRTLLERSLTTMKS
eukprot:GHVU01140169.1.p1 GENE.GHVU01140169.1~~GHVU01140169.1.p1  ORF type:complete len:217 (+),score=23.84 GHVU01140169.1:80-730(+)